MRRLSLLFALICSLLCSSTVSAETITKLVINSTPGDPVGIGQSTTLTPSGSLIFNATYTMTSSNQLMITLHNLDYTLWWQIELSAANGAPLTVGTYSNASYLPFIPPHPIMQASSSHGLCAGGLNGEFTIKELVAEAPHTVTSCWVTLEQSCGGTAPPLHLEFMYNMSPATPTNTSTWGRLKTIYR